jgi:hypothetical protein
VRASTLFRERRSADGTRAAFLGSPSFARAFAS